MPPTINRVALGEKLYFLESPDPTENRVIIWAHGALLHGDGWYDLAAGLRVHYYVRFGENRTSNTIQAISGPTYETPLKPKVVSTGPKRIRNYTLWKVLDRSDACGDYDRVESTMQENQLLAKRYQWTPHVVTVRRRLTGIGKSIQLGAVIDSVRGTYPQVTEFYYGACRGNYSEHWLKSALGRVYIELTTSRTR